jgi:hypothetical protein
VDAHDGVRGVVLSREELLDLGLLDLLLPAVEVGGEILGDVLPVPRPLHEGADLLFAVPELSDEVELLLKVASLAGQLLAPGGVRPDVRVGELLLYFGEGLLKRSFVKDTPGRRWRGARDLRSDPGARRS